MTFRLPIVAAEVALCVLTQDAASISQWPMIKLGLALPYAIWTSLMIVFFDRTKRRDQPKDTPELPKRPPKDD